MLKNIINKALVRCLFSSETKAIELGKKYSQKITKSRPIMSLYKLQPKLAGEIFIAPNATIVGQVYIGSQIHIGHGTVLRGDINAIYIHYNVIIGDNCVLHTASCLPNGLPADLTIIQDCVISPGCTLYSCYLDHGCFIGANSVILQGARIDQGAVLLPNSVVPPGRVVPSHQVWGGNPIKFIRFTREQQKFVTNVYAKLVNEYADLYKYQFLPLSNGYLYKKDDPENDKIRSCQTIMQGEVKSTFGHDPSNPTV